MGHKTRKLNAIDSLFGGISRGLGFASQLRDQRSRRGLQERGLGLQERGLGIREDELDLKTQKALEAEQFRNSFMQLLSQQGGSSQLPSLNAPAALFGPPQGTPPTPATPTAPVIQESTTLPLSGSQALLSRDTRVTQPLVPTSPVDPLSETFAQPPTLEPVTPVAPLPQQVNDQERLVSITSFIQQLEQSLAEPETPTTVTLNVPGGGSISRTLDKRATPDQHFSHFIEQMKKNFPTLTPADLSGLLRNSTLRDTNTAQKFFERNFNSAVNREFRFLRSQSTESLTTVKKNQLRANAVEETVKNFGGYVSKRHEKLFQEIKPQKFALSERLQGILQTIWTDVDAMQENFANDPRGAEAKMEEALRREQNTLSATVNRRVTADGKLNMIVTTTDIDGNVQTEVTQISNLDFGRVLTTRQDAKTKTVDSIIKKAGQSIVAARDIQSLINNMAKDIRGIPEDQLDATLGFAGGFNIWANNVVDNLKGFAKSSTLPGAAGVRQVLDSFKKSKLFQDTIGREGARAQRIKVQYITLILKSASLIGLGEARAISDRDLELVMEAISASGATSFKASLSALNDEANRQSAFNVGIIQNPRQLFQPQPPNPDPFTGEIRRPGKPFLPTPNFFGPEATPALQQGIGSPEQGANDFLTNEGF